MEVAEALWGPEDLPFPHLHFSGPMATQELFFGDPASLRAPLQHVVPPAATAVLQNMGLMQHSTSTPAPVLDALIAGLEGVTHECYTINFVLSA